MQYKDIVRGSTGPIKASYLFYRWDKSDWTDDTDQVWIPLSITYTDFWFNTCYTDAPYHVDDNREKRQN